MESGCAVSGCNSVFATDEVAENTSSISSFPSSWTSSSSSSPSSRVNPPEGLSFSSFVNDVFELPTVLLITSFFHILHSFVGEFLQVQGQRNKDVASYCN